MKNELARAVRELHLPMQRVDPLCSYLRLLASWNEMFNLTAIPSERWVKWHIVDSLSLIPFLRPQGEDAAWRGADLGSGAGLPGIPLAIALPQSHWTLIEKNLKRASFLFRVKNELRLFNVEVIHKRAEDIRPTAAGLFHYMTARAVGRCARLCHLTFPLLMRGGQLLAMKGRLTQTELDEVAAPWQLQGVHKIVYPSTLSIDSPAEETMHRSVAIWEKRG